MDATAPPIPSDAMSTSPIKANGAIAAASSASSPTQPLLFASGSGAVQFYWQPSPVPSLRPVAEKERRIAGLAAAQRCGVCEHPFPPAALRQRISYKAILEQRARWGRTALKRRDIAPNALYATRLVCSFCAQFFDAESALLLDSSDDDDADAGRYGSASRRGRSQGRGGGGAGNSPRSAATPETSRRAQRLLAKILSADRRRTSNRTGSGGGGSGDVSSAASAADGFDTSFAASFDTPAPSAGHSPLKLQPNAGGGDDVVEPPRLAMPDASRAGGRWLPMDDDGLDEAATAAVVDRVASMSGGDGSGAGSPDGAQSSPTAAAQRAPTRAPSMLVPLHYLHDQPPSHAGEKEAQLATAAPTEDHLNQRRHHPRDSEAMRVLRRSAAGLSASGRNRAESAFCAKLLLQAAAARHRSPSSSDRASKTTTNPTAGATLQRPTSSAAGHRTTTTPSAIISSPPAAAAGATTTADRPPGPRARSSLDIHVQHRRFQELHLANRERRASAVPYISTAHLLRLELPPGIRRSGSKGR